MVGSRGPISCLFTKPVPQKLQLGCQKTDPKGPHPGDLNIPDFMWHFHVS